MIKKLLIISTMFFCIAQYLYASCYTGGTLGEARKGAYEASDIVFLGILLSVDDNNRYKFLVLETYKGNAFDTIQVIFEKYHCPIYIDDVFSLCIIYGNSSELYNYIYVDMCSISRSINKPNFLCTDDPLPPLFYENETKNNNMLKGIDYIEKQLYNLWWRAEFFNEIEMLRALKKASDKQNNKDNQNNFSVRIDNLILWFVLLSIVLTNIYLVVKVNNLTRKIKK